MIPLTKALALAASPAGRKVLRQAIAVARSEEGRKLIVQAHKVAAGPEGRKLIGHARRAAVEGTKAATSPANRDRLEAIRAALANRRR
jgi:hypothetical protein